MKINEPPKSSYFQKDLCYLNYFTVLATLLLLLTSALCSRAFHQLACMPWRCMPTCCEHFCPVPLWVPFLGSLLVSSVICFCRCQGVLSGFFEYGTKVSYRLYTLSRNHRFHKQRGNPGYDCEQYLCDSIKS